MNASTRHTGGFTLIELVIVIVILFILTGISVSGFRAFATSSYAETSARRIVGVLEEAQAKTLSSNTDVEYGVHLETDSVTLYPGPTYTAGGADNSVYTLRNAEITNITLSGGGSDIVFARLRGTVSASGTITVTQTNNPTISRTITIYATGLAEVDQ